MKIEIVGNENYGAIVEKSLASAGIQRVIGFSGGADDKLREIADDDELQGKYQSFRDSLQRRIISDALRVFRGYPIAVLTGGTFGGVPEVATKTAKEFDFFTIGVHPRKGQKYALPDEFLDLSITVDPMIGDAAWGDEGATWTSMVDGLIVIGGGAGTLTECAHIQKINEGRLKRKKIPKFVVPIYGTGGVADQLLHLWAKPEVRSASMPTNRIHTGNAAAQAIIEKLSLDDYFDPSFHSQPEN